MKQSRISLFTVVVFLMVLSAAFYIVWSGFTTFFGTYTLGSFWEKADYTKEFEGSVYIDDIDLSIPCVAVITHEAGSGYSRHILDEIILPFDTYSDLDRKFDPDKPIPCFYDVFEDFDSSYITIHSLADSDSYQAVYTWDVP